MKKLILSTLLTGIFFTSAVQAEANIERGQKLVKQTCALCHGREGEKSAMNQSKIIKGMPDEEIQKALNARKNDEIIGAGNAAKSRLNEQDMADIAAFLSNLK